MSDETQNVKLTISGKLQFEDDITLSQAAQVVAFLSSSAAVAPSHISQGSTTTPRLLGRTSTSSPREALEASGAKTNPEKIVALAVHVIQEGSKETFTIDDIRPLFKRAGEPPPANFARDLETAIRTGWVFESEEKGEYHINNKVSRVLEDTFEPLRAGRRVSRGGGAKSSGTKRLGGALPPFPRPSRTRPLSRR